MLWCLNNENGPKCGPSQDGKNLKFSMFSFFSLSIFFFFNANLDLSSTHLERVRIWIWIKFFKFELIFMCEEPHTSSKCDK